MRPPTSSKYAPKDRLNDDARWLIVHTMQQHNNVTLTARIVGCSKSAVRTWWGRYQANGNVSNAVREGSRRLFSEEVEDAALELLTVDGGMSADQASTTLLQRGLISKKVTKGTLISGARRAAKRTDKKLWVQRGKPLKAMTKATKEKRLAFALKHLNTDFSTWLFTDRKKFHFRYPGSKVRCQKWILGDKKQEATTVYQPNHAMVVNLYAGVSKYGISSAHKVTGSSKYTTTHTNLKGQLARNITSGEYKEVLNSTLLPEGQRLFTSQGISTWTLQQDNDPTHKVAALEVENWNKSKGSSVQLLSPWPPNSPDLNLIENIWSWVQREVDKMGCNTFEEFEAAVLSKLAAVPKSHLTNLWGSMAKRLKLVVEAKGGPTKY